MKKKKSNTSREVFEKGDLVRLYRPKKSYSLYEYKVEGFPDRFEEEELLKVVGEP